MDKDKVRKEEKFYTFNYVYHDDDNFVVNIVDRGYGIKKKKRRKEKMKKERFVYQSMGDLKIGEGTFFHYSGLKIYLMKTVQWVTFESTTGLPLSWGNTKKEAIETTKKQLDSESGKKFLYEITFGVKYLETRSKVRQFKLDNGIDID